MRIILIIAAAVIVLVSGFLGGAYFFYFPQKAHAQTLDSLRALGFETGYLPEPAAKPGALLYKDIILDPDGIDTIQMLKIDYTPVGLMLLKRLKSIEIYGLNMTGELTQPSLPGIAVSGWVLPAGENVFKGFPTRALHLKDAQVSLLTPEYGALTLNFDAQARRKDKAAEFQATLKSSQRHLTFTAKANGIATAGYWYSDLEIEQGKFELPDLNIKATRMNGWMNITASENVAPEITSELRAGGLNIMDLPWQNAAATLEIKNGGFKVFAEGKSIGHEGTEFVLNVIQDPDKPPYVSGALHAATVAKFFDYLESRNKLFVPRRSLSLFEPARDISVEFDFGHTITTEKKELKYRIRSNNQDIGIKGSSSINSADEFTAIITSQPMFLNKAQSVFALEGGTAGMFKSGILSFSGDIRKEPQKEPEINLKAEVKDASFDYVTDITGTFTLNPKTGAFSAKDQTGCRLPLHQDISQKCSININAGADGIVLKDLKAQVFGGQLKTTSYTPGKSDQRFVLEVKDLSLQKFLQALDIENLDARGRLSGTVPVTINDGKAVITNAVLNNAGKGNIAYETRTLPAFFKGDEFERETMRMALENYDFEYFEIRLNGPVQGNIDAEVFARGRNPDILNGRPVVISFKTELPAESLLGPVMMN